MKKYENYKDSGLEWLGMVPEHWKIMKMKYICNVTDGTHFSPATISEGKPYITVSNVKDDFIDIESAGRISIADFNELVKQGCQPKTGDVLLAKDGTVGRSAIVKDNDYVVLSSLGILSPNDNLTSSYLKYMLDSSTLQEQMNEAMAGSALRRITITKIKDFIILLPPTSEQRTIASYLDQKVGQIDALISEKEKMVEDLKAYRSSLITETVTKGLNKEVEMKDSGVEWLGMVPKHWEIVPLKYLLSEPLQYGANESADNCNPLEPRYIRITDITEGGKLRKSTYRTLPYQKAEGYMLKKGDILFARSGATVGKTFIFEEDYDACFAGYLIKASCNERLLPMFLYYFTSSNSYENWKNSIFNQATIQNIGADKYCALPITTPSSEEQKRIISFLSPKVNQIDTSISEIEHQLSDLKSYKSSLITEAVTGKIDLRDWQTKNHNALW